MSQKPKQSALFPTSIKLRWALLLLITVSSFVVFANAPKTEFEPLQGAAIENRDATQTVALLEEMPANEDASQVDRVARARIDQTMQDAQNEPARALPTPEAEAPLPDGEIKTHLVRRGDTISSILERYRVSGAMRHLLELDKTASALFGLDQGDTVELVIRDGKLLSLKRAPNKKTEVLALLKDGRYVVEQRNKPTEIRQAFAIGTVSNSFYHAGLEAGLSDQVIINAVNILGWDIDFILDVRKGDTFAVVHEEEWLAGEKLADLGIVAVEYVNRGQAYRAVRYTDSSGDTQYYTPAGKNVKRPFIRTPLEFTRISSRFSPRRLHPVHKVYRPHRGVDYAAPTGTPVYSTGSGTIIFRGRKGGYGNVVIIQHGHRYKTLYAHLSKFARNQRVGSRVKQKQTIGYVGQTGYATGPHLHYEFRVNDVHKNPLKVKLPHSKSLPKSKLAHFGENTKAALNTLDTLGRRYHARR